ncbi:hypothetical protein L1049_000919 [Liquidambar formosana]|uniref:DUF4220 domain-containing protein n=1 Tax=Liquidambar formosana TaxID=63359 RepID=A0AAP0NCB8_LIQFO
MASLRIPDKWKSLWDLWDIRVAVLLSLSYQILLISIASLRKRSGNIFLTVFVWSSYLLADWVATFALGLIASGLNDCGKPALDEDLITFWAPFFCITAFSLEDNELWIRHLLQLIIHLLLVAYVFTQSLPNGLWIPISLVYLAGFIKYFERTRSLYLASLATLKTSTLPKPTAGSNYVRLMEARMKLYMGVCKSKDDASIPVDIILAEAIEVEPDHSVKTYLEFEVVQSGYRFFNDFKGLIVDLTYGHREWQKSRDFFFKTSPKDAFRIMEVELNFLYDMLYTKMVVVHKKWGFAFRFVCLGCIVLALERFVSHHHMHHTHIHEVDIYITYTLIIGAIGLDLFGIIKLIFSDWTIAKLENFKSKVVLGLMLFIRKTISLDGKHRWSNSLSQHSLISYCLKEQFKWIEKLVDHFGAMDFLDEILYKNSVHVESDNDLKVLKWIKKAVKCIFRAKEAETVNGDRLKKFIFEELRDKALKAKTSKDAKEICSWRGERPLLEASRSFWSLTESVEVEYDESVLRWHVATELCHLTEDNNDKDESRQFCKILSKYMLYLLIMRPTMMSEVTGIVHIRFQDT